MFSEVMSTTGLLRSMKAKLGGSKEPKTKSGAEQNDKEPSPAAPVGQTNPPYPSSNTAMPAGPAPLRQATTNAADHRDPPHFVNNNREAMLQAFRDPLPSFRDAPPSERQDLFMKKLQICTFIFDFTDPTIDAREKEIKRATLQELVDYINTGNGKFTEVASPYIVGMLTANLFRALPPSRHSSQESYDLDEEEPNLESAWPHLAIVYEFLLRYVVSSDTDAKVAKRYVDQEFVVKLLDLFDSEDPRERDYLKTILHRIYGKFMVHRPFIRRAINYVFYRFVYETERHNGIAELLEILGSIINGFALPLKEEHKQFLVRALMPLHKPKCLPMYHQQLSYCVTQFVEKDPRLAEPVIRVLLRYWPITNSHKEVLFLGELEEILELIQSEEFERMAGPLFRRIALCLTSCHFQVGERSLFLWNNEYIVQLVSLHRATVLPLVVGALEHNAKHHWNPAVHNLSLNVRKMFQEMDAELYEQCRRRYEEGEAKKTELEAQRCRSWEEIEKRGAVNAVAARNGGGCGSDGRLLTAASV